MLELLDNQLFFVLALLITAGAVAELLTRFVTVAFPYLMRGLSKLRATNQLFWFFVLGTVMLAVIITGAVALTFSETLLK